MAVIKKSAVEQSRPILSSSSPAIGSSVPWEDAPTELTRRCVFTQIYGDTGTGRTTLALTAPGPIALIHAAEKLEGIVQPQARQGKVIKLVNFGGTFRGAPQEIQKQAEVNENRMFDAWYDSYRWARTTILDTDTEAYQLSRLAEFGALRPSSGRIERNWEGINSRWRSLLNSFRGQDRTHVILIGQTEDEWTKPKGDKIGSKTGKSVRSGQKEIPIKADLGLRTFVSAEGDFTVRIEKPWWNSAFLGGEVSGLTLPQIIALITETDESEWV